MEEMHRFIQQRRHILPYLVGQGLEMMHDMVSLLFLSCFPDLVMWQCDVTK